MRLHPPERVPLDAESATRLDETFRSEIAGKTLQEALARYRVTMDELLGTALAGDALACGPGCSTCCHQPLLVSFLELATIFFSDEPRFGSQAFRDSLRGPMADLQKWKAQSGKHGASGVAQRQFHARKPCVLLAPDGRCSAYEARPFLCRNAVSDVRCTFENLESRGFGDLAAMARRLRQRIVEAYDLKRFDLPPIKVETAVFYLPEGLAWFAEKAPRDALRALFTPTSA